MLVSIISLQIPDDWIDTEKTKPEKQFAACKINEVTVLVVVILESLVHWLLD